MTMSKEDPIENVINNGIKRDINIALDNKCYRAAVILIYAGIDAMAYLNLEEEKNEVTKIDFISWADNYIKMEGETEVGGIELYSARCSILHTYGAHSSLTRKGKSRVIGYMNESVPIVRYRPDVDKDLVLISVPALRDAFFQGIDDFIAEVLENQRKEKLFEERMNNSVFFACHR